MKEFYRFMGSGPFAWLRKAFVLLDLADGALCWSKPKISHFSVFLQYFPVQINKGEHGFDNQEMDMKPFFRAVGPAFHKNLEVGPFETVNIYPLMCHILGIQPEVNDGHLDATKHMLVGSSVKASLSPGESPQLY